MREEGAQTAVELHVLRGDAPLSRVIRHVWVAIEDVGGRGWSNRRAVEEGWPKLGQLAPGGKGEGGEWGKNEREGGRIRRKKEKKEKYLGLLRFFGTRI